MVVSLLAVFLGGTSASAQDWAKAMFNATSHDFGVVARGAKVEYRFIVENIYEEDAHIQSVSSSCGCSKPKVNKTQLKTWEKAEVLVTVDTRGFLGRKDATITVVFDLPFRAEVQLHVYTYIRSDIVVQPGEVSFGSVLQGKEAKQTVNISYAGRSDWQIDRVECVNPNVEAVATETSRTPGLASYNLSVRLKPDTPPGYLREQLVLVTNDFDAKSARVPVSVEGLVVSPLTVRPSPLSMGATDAGRPLTRSIVVQGQTPFRITEIVSDDPRFRCEPSSEAKTVHILPVTFQTTDAKTVPGLVKSKLLIKTDLPNSPAANVEVSATLSNGTASDRF
jgi:hypothetical protein